MIPNTSEMPKANIIHASTLYQPEKYLPRSSVDSIVECLTAIKHYSLIKLYSKQPFDKISQPTEYAVGNSILPFCTNVILLTE